MSSEIESVDVSELPLVSVEEPTVVANFAGNSQLIRETAYLKWEKAGRPPGDGVNFWLEAETEVLKGGETKLKEEVVE